MLFCVSFRFSGSSPIFQAVSVAQVADSTVQGLLGECSELPLTYVPCVHAASLTLHPTHIYTSLIMLRNQRQQIVCKQHLQKQPRGALCHKTCWGRLSSQKSC